MATPVKGVDSTNEGKLMSCEFELHANVPKEVFEAFAVTQAKLLDIRGYIVKVSDNCYKGVLEGMGKMIEALRKATEGAKQFVDLIVELVMKNFKIIQEYTYKTFEIKQHTE